jgi:hypothetical protein
VSDSLKVCEYCCKRAVSDVSVFAENTNGQKLTDALSMPGLADGVYDSIMA